MYRFQITRDCDTLRLRKVVLELFYGDMLLDRRRMFAGPLFNMRLRRKKLRMLRLGKMMVAHSKPA